MGTHLIDLSDKYHKTLKHLNITFHELRPELLMACFVDLCLFDNLESLEVKVIDFMYYKEYTIDECIQQLTQKCVKLKNFGLECSSISDHFFSALSNLKSVERLKLDFGFIKSKLTTGSVKYLKECHQLNHLSIKYYELNENFFHGIQTFVPNLRTIIISAKKQMSDNFYKSLSSMKYLQKVFVDCDMKFDFKIFYYNKSLKTIEDKNRIQYLSTNCGLIDNIPKEDYYYKLFHGC